MLLSVRNSNEEVLNIPQSTRSGTSPSDVLVLFLRLWLWVSYSSVERQVVYTTALAKWANLLLSLFRLVWFYGISTITSYFMPNPVIYIYIYIYIHICVCVVCVCVCVCVTCKHKFRKLNSSKYYYVLPTI